MNKTYKSAKELQISIAEKEKEIDKLKGNIEFLKAKYIEQQKTLNRHRFELKQSELTIDQIQEKLKNLQKPE